MRIQKPVNIKKVTSNIGKIDSKFKLAVTFLFSTQNCEKIVTVISARSMDSKTNKNGFPGLDCPGGKKLGK